MPPRKKTKLSSRAASSPSVDTPKETTPAATGKGSGEVTRPVLDPDPWTDDQEAALFKNIVRYKPVGLHKHTRMFCILANLRRYGWQEDHISRSGVWQKLDTLYNMEALHEREDADELEQDEAQVEFWLPPYEFGEAMFSRRINLKRSSSPPTLHHQLSHQGGAGARNTSVSEPHKSSPEPEWESGRDSERRRSLRGRGGRGGRGASRAQSEAMTRKRKRAETPPQDEEEEGSGEEDGEEGEDDEGDEEGGDEELGEDVADEDEEEEEDGEDDADEDEDEDEEDEGEEEEEEVEEEPSALASRSGRGRSTRINAQRARGGPGEGAGSGRGGGGKTRGGKAGRATTRGRAGRGGRSRGR